MFSSISIRTSSILTRRVMVGTGRTKLLNRPNNTANVVVRNGSDMPVPQSQNAPLWYGHTVKKEGWEESVYIFYVAAIVLQAAVLLGAPETSIESWARPEAKARLYLSSKGQTEFEFGTHYADLLDKESKELWSKFAAKAVNPGDDDEDDDEEEEEEEGEDEVSFFHSYLFGSDSENSFCVSALNWLRMIPFFGKLIFYHSSPPLTVIVGPVVKSLTYQQDDDDDE